MRPEAGGLNIHRKYTKAPAAHDAPQNSRVIRAQISRHDLFGFNHLHRTHTDPPKTQKATNPKLGVNFLAGTAFNKMKAALECFGNTSPWP